MDARNIFPFIMICALVGTLAIVGAYLAWTLGVHFLAWRLKKKEPQYSKNARQAYGDVMRAMVNLGWITKKEADYQNFNFGMDMWKAEEAGKRLEELNAKLAQLAKDLEEAGDIAQEELTAAHTELAGVEIPDVDYNEVGYSIYLPEQKHMVMPTVKPNSFVNRNIYKRQPLPDDAFYLDHPFPEPAFVPIQEHKHKYRLLTTAMDDEFFDDMEDLPDEVVKIHRFKCTIDDCQYEYFVMDSWLWGKENDNG